MESRMKTVQTVVNRHTAAVEALSSEHAAAMERVEQAVATIKLELSVLRASVVALVVYASCYHFLKRTPWRSHHSLV